MLFNLNEFLMAISFTLDFVEMDILGIRSNHGKRTAYITVNIAKELGLNFKELHDIASLSLLHDNALSEHTLHNNMFIKRIENAAILDELKAHCIIGENNIKNYPFLTDVKSIIKYHHERYDGSGFFKLKGESIPLMSQIIVIADEIEKRFNLRNNNHQMQNEILAFIRSQENKIFSKLIVERFFQIAKSRMFWINLKDDFISKALKNEIPQHSLELTFKEIHDITKVLSKIIDSKSQYTYRHSQSLSEKASIMADFYSFDEEEKMKLIIAADLHDIGKLAVSNDVLDCPNKLSEEEFNIVKRHTYYTRIALQKIRGFEDITEWAANHHEKLNGNGYPFAKKAKDLDFNSRLMSCLDIYEALTEDRPYRKKLTHKEAMDILNNMKENKLIDDRITKDIDNVFKKIV